MKRTIALCDLAGLEDAVPSGGGGSWGALSRAAGGLSLGGLLGRSAGSGAVSATELEEARRSLQLIFWPPEGGGGGDSSSNSLGSGAAATGSKANAAAPALTRRTLIFSSQRQREAFVAAVLALASDCAAAGAPCAVPPLALYRAGEAEISGVFHIHNARA